MGYIPVTTTRRPYGGGGGIPLTPTPRLPPFPAPRWPPWDTTFPWNPCPCGPFEFCPCDDYGIDDYGGIRSGSNSIQTSVDNIVDEESWKAWKDFNAYNLDNEKKA